MRGKVTIIVALLSLAGSAAGAEPPGPGAKVAANYIKIEIKGDLYVEPGYRYDPTPDLRAEKSLGALVSAGSWAATFQLLAERREHYEFLKAHGDRKGGTKVVVTGELVSVVLPYLASQPGPPPFKYVIRVREVRLVGPKK
jgi:hypothetical protein